MPRTNTVNFLQIENGLRQAIELCRSEAGASYAVASAPRLEGLQQALAHCTKRADTAYLGWRECIRKRMLSAKHLWLRFEAMRDELVELGLEVVPAGAKNAWVDRKSVV